MGAPVNGSWGAAALLRINGSAVVRRECGNRTIVNTEIGAS